MLRHAFNFSMEQKGGPPVQRGAGGLSLRAQQTTHFQCKRIQGHIRSVCPPYHLFYESLTDFII